MAQALGAPPDALPTAWPDEVYGWLLRLDFDAHGMLVSTQASNQQLMFDDRGVSP